MRTLIGMLVVVGLCIAVVGFYRNWFTLSGDGRGTESSKVTLTLDADKVREDAEKAKDKTTELSGKVKEEAKDLAGQARDNVRSDNN